MAQRPLQFCRKPGCNEMTREASGYCKSHRAEKKTDELYKSREWRRLRGRYLEAFPLCAHCQAAGRVEAASIVHHKTPVKAGGDPWAWDNLESLCAACHNKEHGNRQEFRRHGGGSVIVYNY